MLQLTPFWSRLFWEHPFPRQPPAHHGLGAEVFLPQESDTGRELSICLFQYVMGLATGARKEEMKKEMWETLLLLVFHLRDQKENVAKAAQEALCFTGRFLKWQELTELARTAKPWEISKCLVSRAPVLLGSAPGAPCPMPSGEDAGLCPAAICTFLEQALLQALLIPRVPRGTLPPEWHPSISGEPCAPSEPKRHMVGSWECSAGGKKGGPGWGNSPTGGQLCANPAPFSLQLERKRRKTKDFLHQSEVYLQSPQEILRQDTVRFIGLIGQHVDECRTTEYIKQGE
ncbi:uncharacterized protein PRD47_013778 isoform 2-T2 [Ara ararauna]